MDFTQICLTLEKTLSSNQNERRQAENLLSNMEKMEGFGPILLQICCLNTVLLPIRVSAAISLKNLIKKSWPKESDLCNLITVADKLTIKDKIIDVMLMAEPIVQRQMCDSITIIGKEDFPFNWNDLLPKLVNHFVGNDFNAITGVLRTGHSLFKKYRYEFKSEELWTEIKFVLDNFAAQLTVLMERCMQLLQAETNQQLFICVFDATIFISKIFYSLNYQDLPEFFEDNIEKWMKFFIFLLSNDFTKFKQISGSNSDGDRMDILRSQICTNVSLYVTKYEEEFQPYLNCFLQSIWSLLIENTDDSNEIFSSHAIQFFASVSEKAAFKHLFDDKATLEKICSSVIIPNIRIREIDEENFNDNSEEYIRQDIEGSDVDTKRRAISDLIRGLNVHFEGQIIEIFSKYLGGLLQEYNTNPKDNWRSKDIAIFLVICLATKKQTIKHGVTEVGSFINVADFFSTILVADLQNIKTCHPIIITDILKYICCFRNFLPVQILCEIWPFVVNLLVHSNQIISIYGCLVIDRLLSFDKTSPNLNQIKAVAIQNKDILLNNYIRLLFSSANFQNEHVMKSMIKVVSILGCEISNNINVIISKTSEKLIEIYKNPMKPNFVHYLFETICVSLKMSCQTNPNIITSFEQALFPIFQDILSNDIADFMPYVFQVLSLMLNNHQTVPIPPVYAQLLPLLITPDLWLRSGVIPGLSVLVNTYLTTMSTSIIQSGKLPAILGVFQKLISSTTNDQYGMMLLSNILQNVPYSDLQPFIKEILIILFQRLTNIKTTKFVKNFILWICLYSSLRNPDEIIEIVDSIQPKLFSMLIERLFLNDLNKMNESYECKLCSIGTIKLLCQSKRLCSDDYINQWSKLLEVLISLLETSANKSSQPSELDEITNQSTTDGYEVAHSQLISCKQSPVDLFINVTDLRLYLIEQLKSACANNHKLMALINTQLQQPTLQIIHSYLTTYKITLN